MGFGSFFSSLDPTKKGTITNKVVSTAKDLGKGYAQTAINLNPVNAITGKTVDFGVKNTAIKSITDKVATIGGATIKTGVAVAAPIAGAKVISTLGDKVSLTPSGLENLKTQFTASDVKKALANINIDTSPTVGIVTNALQNKPQAQTNSITPINSFDWKSAGKKALGSLFGVVDDELTKTSGGYVDVKKDVTKNEIMQMLTKYWYIPTLIIAGISYLLYKAFGRKRK